ncbi:hypothetical protein [Yersinia ruckeri]|uniref:hypothetical protein n=1 Tax=Yersinia ruckeri TaxID=29486 RepID=UPI0008FD8D72|nr:hypothetical protein [Yersinia ruckeri]OIX45558.1 hypothetical protein AXW22_08815 [Yersinia ruckeri]
MTTYIYSAKNNAFFPVDYLDDYSHWDLSDAVEVSDGVAMEFMGGAPIGKVRAAGVDGHPCWTDKPPALPLSDDELASLARQYRDAFIVATDNMMVSDYSIDDIPLTSTQRTELMVTRAAYRSWPTLAGWPLIELPVIGESDKSRWLLIEAVNNGYVVPEWPPEFR